MPRYLVNYYSGCFCEGVFSVQFSSVQFSSVQLLSHVQICNPMNCSMPGFPVHHLLLELAETHFHWVTDAIQPSHPLLSPFPPAFNLSQRQGLLLWVSTSVLQIKWPRNWSLSFSISPFNEYSGLILGFTGLTPCSPRDSQESSPTSQFKSINSLALSFLYGPIFTSIHDYWKNHTFDSMDLCWQGNVCAF